ncbi:MAG: phosphatase domain-containing protein [Gemmatimonadota bacterium]|nr:phosphatase domain-containing protein [Gemmatimonadota bacterium]
MSTPGWRRLRHRLGLAGPVTIHPYRSYGAPDRVFVRGRVLEAKGVRRAELGDRWWQNLARTYRRMESAEVGGAPVTIRFAGAETETVADDEGHFRTWLVPGDRPGRGAWHEATVQAWDPARPDAEPVDRIAPVLVPPASARFGVVSDVDDTVIQAGVANLARLVGDVVFGSAHTRAPFPGIAAFFRALHRGVGGTPNPLFYVTNGPWNLYDAFVHFLELHDMPAGPVELRDWGPVWDEVRRIGRREHKLESIRRIFRTVPHLSFLLVGDSGEEDPEIYRDIVHEFPARVPAVYIRDVSRNPLRKREIEALAEEVDAAGSALVLAPDTIAAARHAADHGWIEPASLGEIEAERVSETRRPAPPGRGIVVEEGEESEI